MNRVQVYRNLHTGRFSVRSKETGRVFAQAAIVILNNAVFCVQPGGRDRVRREQTKNVHAWVEGDLNCYNGKILTEFGPEPNKLYAMGQWRAMGSLKCHYNPYEVDHFVDPDGNELESARTVSMHFEKGVYCNQPTFRKMEKAA